MTSGTSSDYSRGGILVMPGSTLQYAFTALINGVAMDSPYYTFTPLPYNQQVHSPLSLTLILTLTFICAMK
jgi:hypothetical protein